MAEAMKQKCFFGTGLMGAPMCCLLKAGFELSVWNRSIVKAEALQADGATLADTPITAVKSADVVITSCLMARRYLI